MGMLIDFSSVQLHVTIDYLSGAGYQLSWTISDRSGYRYFEGYGHIVFQGWHTCGRQDGYWRSNWTIKIECVFDYAKWHDRSWHEARQAAWLNTDLQRWTGDMEYARKQTRFTTLDESCRIAKSMQQGVLHPLSSQRQDLSPIQTESNLLKLATSNMPFIGVYRSPGITACISIMTSSNNDPRLD